MCIENQDPNNPEAAERSPAYQQELRERGDSCIFCDPSPEDEEAIILESEFWRAKSNKYPYDHTTEHIVIFLRRHIETISDLSGEEFLDLLEIVRRLLPKLNIDSGGLCMRFGLTKKSGATIAHFHCHLLAGNGKGDVNFRVAIKAS